MVSVITSALILFNNSRVKDKSYVAYVDINPLIKLNLKVSCKGNDCSNPIVTNYELINEDAKTIYKDLVIKDKTLKETIKLLANTVKEKDIAFKEVHIYSNYDNEEEFKIDSVDYSIVFDAKEENDLNQFIDKLLSQEELLVTKEVLVPLTFNMVEVDNQMMHMQSFEFLEQQDKIVEKNYKDEYAEGYEPSLEKVPDIKFKGIEGVQYYFPITIKGTQDILDTIPNEYTSLKADIKGIADISGLNEGTNETEIQFTSNIPEITILTQPIKIRVQLKLGPKNYSYTDEEGNLKAHYDIDRLKELLRDGYISQERFDELLEKNNN